MSLPSLQLQPVSPSHYFVSGDVTIQAGVAIAPGVLIQADPDSRVVIKTGACIGTGSVLHAHKGLLELGEGVILGAGVLLIGQVQIGANACIGAATTIFNATIEAGQLVPPGALVGNMGRSPDELQATNLFVYPAPKSEMSATPVAPATPAPATPAPGVSTASPTPSTTHDLAGGAEEKDASDIAESDLAESDLAASDINVYGQMYVNQLLVKLFPHRQTRHSPPPPPDPSNPTDDPWNDSG